MEIKKHTAGQNLISEIVSDDIVIKSIDDALDIIGNADSEFIVLHDYNFEKDFFDLSSKKLGDILQKFTTYRIRLAIIGEFEKYPGEAFKDFMFESNRGGEYLFVSSMDQVIKIWGK